RSLKERNGLRLLRDQTTGSPHQLVRNREVLAGAAVDRCGTFLALHFAFEHLRLASPVVSQSAFSRALGAGGVRPRACVASVSIRRTSCALGPSASPPSVLVTLPIRDLATGQRGSGFRVPFLTSERIRSARSSSRRSRC